jgi:hypothetical protein
MIAAYKRAIQLVHARHLDIFGTTITPFDRYRYWTPGLEAERTTINDWILKSQAFDGVIDFAAAVADPANPTWMNPATTPATASIPTTPGTRRWHRR